jgi:hypothetical protein
MIQLNNVKNMQEINDIKSKYGIDLLCENKCYRYAETKREILRYVHNNTLNAYVAIQPGFIDVERVAEFATLEKISLIEWDKVEEY